MIYMTYDLSLINGVHTSSVSIEKDIQLIQSLNIVRGLCQTQHETIPL